MPDTTDMLTIAEAARELKVSRQRIHALIKTYDIATYEPSPKLFFIHKAELAKIPKVRKPGPRTKSK